MRKWRLLLWLFPVLLQAVQAQTGSLSNLRRQAMAVQSFPARLDSLSIVPGSLVIIDPRSGERIDDKAFLFQNDTLRWQYPAVMLPDSVWISYRILPYDIRRPFMRLDTSRLLKAAEDTLLLAYDPFEEAAGPLIDFRGLDYNGSFARGISFGNNQDLVLNSSFNLQLAGDLGEGVEILAAISDENIPLQPEGNTRQLQEFDRIFVQLSKGKNKLIAGDYELRRPDSYFLQYFKKLQGATFSNQTELGPGQLTTESSVAVARGQFARNQIDGLEGNQGPYKLRGMAGERFIIILSGTERVWLDGQLLVRGLEEDYIIDYNRGELTFTNRRLITKDSRITVEFDYSDQTYLRSLYAVNSRYQAKKLDLHLHFIQQQDSRNSSGAQELSDAQKRILSLAGDNPNLAVAPGIDTLEEFSPFRAMYVVVDTLLACGRRDTILQYSTDPQRARLIARFTFVGRGNGDYVLDPALAANERAYRWTPPDPLTCMPQGDYAPVVPLTPPQQQLMLTAGGRYRLSPTAGIKAEMAMSRNDLNRFSPLDSDDDAGLAVFAQLDKQFRLSPGENPWNLFAEAAYEHVAETFRAFTPYRDPEFLRDWSLADQQGFGQVAPAREQLIRGSLSLRRGEQQEISYRLSGFLRDSLYQGIQHSGRIRLQNGGLRFDAQGSLATSAEPGRRTRFLRPRFDLSQTLPWLGRWTAGLYGELEQNERRETTLDTLSGSSFFYHLLRTYLRSPQSDKYQFNVLYQRREDLFPGEEQFSSGALAHEFNLNGGWQAGRALRLDGNLSYRNLQVDEGAAGQPGLEAAETLLGRSDVGLQLWKGAFRSNTTYELGSGQEPRLEFTFIRVNKGEGTHVWLDSLYNNDGVVQANEMEIAPFQDQADFVRVTAFTDDYIQTNYVNFNQSLQLNPKAVWFNAKDWRRLAAKFSSQTSFKINRKTQRAPGVAPWNPFQLDVADSALVAVSSAIRHVFFFNRADPVYDVQLGVEDNRSKQVLTTGFESRRRSEQFLRGRWNFNKALSLQLNLSQGQRFYDSELFSNKDYQIHFTGAEPQLTFLPSQRFRTILRYQFLNSRNTLPESEGEGSVQHDFNLEMGYNQSTNSYLRLRLSLINIDFSGQANSPVGFALLNGLQPGRNFLWNLSLDRQLARNIQLRLSYEGRKTGTARMVHVGRAQVAATF